MRSMTLEAISQNVRFAKAGLATNNTNKWQKLAKYSISQMAVSCVKGGQDTTDTDDTDIIIGEDIIGG